MEDLKARDAKRNKAAKDKFDVQEIARLKAETEGRKHNCELAGCDLDPKGKKIVKTAPGG